jgi:hypothetical protein
MNTLTVPNQVIDLNAILSEVTSISERARARRIDSARAALTAHADAHRAANATYRRQIQSLRTRVNSLRSDRAEAIAAILAADEQRHGALAAIDQTYDTACAQGLHAVQLHTQAAEAAVLLIGQKRTAFIQTWDAAWESAHDLDAERARLETLKDEATQAFDDAELTARLELEEAKAEAEQLVLRIETDARAVRDAAIAAAMTHDFGAATARRRLLFIERRNARAAIILWQMIARLAGEREAVLAAADAALAEARVWDSEGFDALEAEARLQADAALARAQAEAEAQLARETAIESDANELIRKWTAIAVKVSGNPHALRAQRDAALHELRGSPARNRAARAIRKVFAALNEANQYLAGFSLTNQPLPAKGWRVITDEVVLIYGLDKTFVAGWQWREHSQSEEIPFGVAVKQALIKYIFGAKLKATPGTTVRDAMNAKRGDKKNS